MPSPPDNKKPEHRKRITVEPGKSVSVEDLNPVNEHDEPDNSGSEVTKSEVMDSEDDDSGNSFNESGISPLMYAGTTVGQWVKVLYEGEVFIHKILQKTAGETMVQCLEKPFGIKELQKLEKEQDAVLYENVYQCDVIPKLQKAGGGWKYSY